VDVSELGMHRWSASAACHSDKVKYLTPKIHSSHVVNIARSGCDAGDAEAAAGVPGTAAAPVRALFRASTEVIKKGKATLSPAKK